MCNIIVLVNGVTQLRCLKTNSEQIIKQVKQNLAILNDNSTCIVHVH